MFYVYEWFNNDTQEIFYVGKGCKSRYRHKGKNRNYLFNEYIKNNNCSSRIIKFFDNENEAFKFEQERILKLNPKCNIAIGGFGGFQVVWTDEMRQHMSINNPMKDFEKRKNLSNNNPMKNKDIAKIVGIKHRKIPVINGIIYESSKQASLEFNVHIETIRRWCKRGYDTNGNICYYKNQKPKNNPMKITNSKKVLVNNMQFNSIKEASDYIGCWSETLIRAIKNNRKCKGYICKYDNQQPSQVNVEKK